MKNFLYPIYKLPEEFMQDYEKRELPRYMKYWLYLKSKIKKSIIEEGSSFNLSGTVNKKFIKFEIEGNTEQKILIGKNLLNIKNINNTSNGLKFDGTDGINLKIKGIYNNTTSYANTDRITFNLPIGTYVFSYDPSKLPNGTRIGIWTTPTNINLTNGQSITTTQELTSFQIVFIGLINGKDYDVSVNLQLEKGLTPTDFEPYCDEICIPKYNSPQPIKNVIGNIKNIISNKNLFDGEIELGSINPSNGELQTNTARTRSKNFTKVEPNTTYTISVENGGYRWIIGYTKNKVGITDGQASGQASAITTFPSTVTKSYTFTTTPTTEYIKWYDTNSTDLSEKVQIELRCNSNLLCPTRRTNSRIYAFRRTKTNGT